MSNPMDTKTHRQRIGRIGEDAVTLRYAEMGFTVVARNLHVSHNEIDLIMENETHLAFVEVKTRHATPHAPSRYGRPAAAIDLVRRTECSKGTSVSGMVCHIKIGEVLSLICFSKESVSNNSCEASSPRMWRKES